MIYPTSASFSERAYGTVRPFLPLKTVVRATLLPIHFVATLLSCATFGKSKKINAVLDENLPIKTDILKELFIDFDALLKNRKECRPSDGDFYQANGYVTRKLVDPISRYAEMAKTSDSLFEKYALSRLAFGYCAIVGVATKIADLVIGLFGVIALPFSGKAHETVFYATLNQLSSSFIVRDFCYNLKMFVNPHQEI
jgi:hypothetical protein